MSTQDTNKIYNIEEDKIDEILNTKKYVVIDFWAPWCGPCRMLGPVFEKIARENNTEVAFVKVNVDENQNTAQKYNVQTIPTILFIENGKLIHTITGYKDENFLKSEINKQFKLN
ncbi:MAG: thioredoxin [Rickettsiales bacterium]